jgi:hypothetical protein
LFFAVEVGLDETLDLGQHCTDQLRVGLLDHLLLGKDEKGEVAEP